MGNTIADELADLGTRLEALHRWWKRVQPMGQKCRFYKERETPCEQALRIPVNRRSEFSKKLSDSAGTDSTFASSYECNCTLGSEMGFCKHKIISRSIGRHDYRSAQAVFGTWTGEGSVKRKTVMDRTVQSTAKGETETSDTSVQGSGSIGSAILERVDVTGRRRTWNIWKNALTLHEHFTRNSSQIHHTQKYLSGSSSVGRGNSFTHFL